MTLSLAGNEQPRRRKRRCTVSDDTSKPLAPSSSADFTDDSGLKVFTRETIIDALPHTTN